MKETQFDNASHHKYWDSSKDNPVVSNHNFQVTVALQYWFISWTVFTGAMPYEISVWDSASLKYDNNVPQTTSTERFLPGKEMEGIDVRGTTWRLIRT